MKNKNWSSGRGRWRGILLAQALLTSTATVEAQTTGAIPLDRSRPAEEMSYLQARAAYLHEPTTAAALRMLEAGTRSKRTDDQLECSQLGRKWVRDRALVTSQAETAALSSDLCERQLGRLAFRAQSEKVVRVDGERLDASVLSSPWAVLPGVHLVSVGSLEAEIHVGAGQVVDVEPSSTSWRGGSRWQRAPRYWPDAKIATEVALSVCAVAGLASSLTYLYAQGDDLERGAHRIEGAERAFVITGVAAGATCLIGTLVVPFVWDAPKNRRRSSPPSAHFAPFEMRGTF